MTQAQLAEELTKIIGQPVSERTIGEMERGKRSVSAECICALSEALVVPVCNLLNTESGKDADDVTVADAFRALPEDQREEMLALFQEFEDYETPEARFAHVLDNLQPLMLNNSNNGGDWREHQVKRSQVYKRNARTSTGSETLWAYMEGLIQGNVEKGNIQDC